MAKVSQTAKKINSPVQKSCGYLLPPPECSNHTKLPRNSPGGVNGERNLNGMSSKQITLRKSFSSVASTPSPTVELCTPNNITPKCLQLTCCHRAFRKWIFTSWFLDQFCISWACIQTFIFWGCLLLQQNTGYKSQRNKSPE